MRLKLGLLAAALLAAGCSGLDTREPAAIVSAEAPAATKTYLWSSSMEAKRVALEKATLNTGIAVLRTKDNQLQVNVPSDFSFDTDSAEIKPDMRPVLDQFAEGLEAKTLSHMLIHIIGHTDSRGSDAVNDPLSLARANSVRKHLESKGIATSRIEVEGRGEHQPMVGNDKSYGRALNRRVEILLREPGGTS
ncbi:OmpA family protein [Piscinibacter sp.]|jgi:outer membrane protein OmpA-like peptidoglycan-associated protein|uniref:OmpA family protein n=1 Tax=Piscinibacter sp. TaxID=1903157 RepID=UPI002F426DA7